MSPDLGYGCLYVAAHQIWAWTFRSVIDPRARRLMGRYHRAPVIWAPATTFPVEMWAWGVGEGGAARISGRLAATGAALCMAGAFLPIVALGVLLLHVHCSARLSHVLYLMTMPMMLLFVGLQAGPRRSDGDTDAGLPAGDGPARPKLRDDGVYRPKERGVP